MGYRSIVVGTDGSETAGKAVTHAAKLAAAFGARLTIVTAFSPHAGETARVQAEVPDELRWRITDSAAAEEKGNEARKLARGEGAKEVAVFVENGDPASVLLDAVDQYAGDLIVVGSKGMTGTRRFVLGSVPNKISHHAPCDVIIVHTT